MQTTIDYVESDVNSAVVIALVNAPTDSQQLVKINNYINKDYFIYFSLDNVDKQIIQRQQY